MFAFSTSGVRFLWWTRATTTTHSVRWRDPGDADRWRLFGRRLCLAGVLGGCGGRITLSEPGKGGSVQGSRFVFFALPEFEHSGEVSGESVTWTLVSPNNRRLGQASGHFSTYEECLAAVQTLRTHANRALSATVAVDKHGRWAWRVDLDGVTVAVSTRGYLRQQECDYNLRRFLEALPEAGVTTELRAVRAMAAQRLGNR